MFLEHADIIFTLVKIAVPGRKLFLELLNYDAELVCQRLSISWWGGRFRSWKCLLISLILVACTVIARAMTHFLSDNHGTVLPCFIVKMSIPFPRRNTVLNLLKTKCRPLYLKIQFVPRCKHFSTRL
jgi:hypothetical protein